MLVNKKLTKYGYHANVRYDTISPLIYVIEKGEKLLLDGELDMHVVTGEALLQRLVEKKLIKDKLSTGNTYRLPIEQTTEIEAIEQTVIIVHQDNLASNYITDFKCIEDEPSSDDLQYIEGNEYE